MKKIENFEKPLGRSHSSAASALLTDYTLLQLSSTLLCFFLLLSFLLFKFFFHLSDNSLCFFFAACRFVIIDSPASLKAIKYPFPFSVFRCYKLHYSKAITEFAFQLAALFGLIIMRCLLESLFCWAPTKKFSSLFIL